MLDKPLTYKSQVSIVEADDKLPPAPTVLMSDQFIANYKLKVLFFLTMLQSLSYTVIAYILIKLQVLYLAFSADQMAETHDEEKVLLYIILVATIFINLHQNPHCYPLYSHDLHSGMFELLPGVLLLHDGHGPAALVQGFQLHRDLSRWYFVAENEMVKMLFDIKTAAVQQKH